MVFVFYYDPNCILNVPGSKIAAALVAALVNTLIPLAFKPAPGAFGTLGETFSNTKFRGKAATGAMVLRSVKRTQALLGLIKFSANCILELDGVDATITKEFFERTRNRPKELGIAYTLHWVKMNFNLNTERVKNMYGYDKVQAWINCLHQLFEESVRKVFTNGFMIRCGLDS